MEDTGWPPVSPVNPDVEMSIDQVNDEQDLHLISTIPSPGIEASSSSNTNQNVPASSSDKTAKKAMFGSTLKRSGDNRKRQKKNDSNKKQKTKKAEKNTKKVYLVSDVDIKLYVEKHKISQPMFSFYLSKKIGFECNKSKRRLTSGEVKKLFPFVRSICFELLSTVNNKKRFNKEKKLVLSSINRSARTQYSWADIVKGKQIPSTEKSILVAARDNKIQRLISENNELKKSNKKLSEEKAALELRLSNILQRVESLEKKEQQRSALDPYKDKKKLAGSGQPLCHICLPAHVFSYKKPVIGEFCNSDFCLRMLDTSVRVPLSGGIKCANCSNGLVFVERATKTVLGSCNNDSNFVPTSYWVSKRDKIEADLRRQTESSVRDQSHNLSRLEEQRRREFETATRESRRRDD